MTLTLQNFSAVLLDLDGTLYVEGHPVDGAVDLVVRLTRERLRYASLTNSSASPRQIERRLAHMGITLPADHIWSCSAAAADYVLQRFGTAGRRPRVFNCGSDGITDLLDEKVDWVTEPAQPCDVVIAAAPSNPESSPQRQWIALQLLRGRPGLPPAALVGSCADRVYPSPRGFEFGAGSLTQMLAYAAGVTPVYTGKPEPVFFHELCGRLGVAPDRCLLIGDNLDSDIAGGRSVGMTTALVLTGVARREDLVNLPPHRTPDFVIESLRDLL